MTHLDPTATAPQRSERDDGPSDRWWREAVVYQVYVRSFADANGDGIGDLAGVRARLPYLRDLGVDALWFNPWYPSPLADAGYDISDYRAIDPDFGTLEEAEAAHRRGRCARDADDRRHRPEPRLRPASVVPRGARSPSRARPSGSASGSGPARARTATAPPNGWQSIFGGSAWTRRGGRRVVPASVRTRAARPQLDAPRRLGRARGHPSLLVRPRRRRRAHRLGGAPRQAPRPRRARGRRRARRAPVHRPGRAPRHLPPLARDCRRLRRAARSRRRGVARRIPTGSPATCGRTSCTPRSTSTSWRARGTARACARRSSRRSPRTPPSTPPPTWVLSNHDVTRPVTRYGRADTSFSFESKREGTPDRPRARDAPSAGGGAACDGAARIAVRLPGRGARPSRGRGHPPRAPAGPDVAPLRRDRSQAATAAGSRCRGTATCRPTGSADDGVPTRPGSTNPTTGPRSRLLRSPRATDVHALPLPGRPPLPPAAPWGDGAFQLAAVRRLGPRLRTGRAASVCIVNFGPDPSSCPQAADVLIASNELEGGALPHGHHRLAVPAGRIGRRSTTDPHRGQQPGARERGGR